MQRYAGNPTRRKELGLTTAYTFNNLNQFSSGSWTGKLTVIGEVNYAAGTVTVNGVTGKIFPDRVFEATNITVSVGTNVLTAVYHGPAFTNTQMVATDKVTVVVGNAAYTHDANGNLTADQNFTYQYDLANRLTNVILKASNVSVLAISYDGLGRRIQVVRNGSTVERYVYFPGSFLVLAVLDGSNAVKEIYTHGPDISGVVDGAGGIGGILSVSTNIGAASASKYFHADAMGNVILVSGSDGKQVASYGFTPFGKLVNQVGDYRARFLFGSKEYDPETRLVLYGYRYLVPKHGGWLTRDPLGEMGGVNLYSFVLNSPFNKYDAHGLKPCCGADCTESLKQALLAANSRFDSHGWWVKFYGCFKMFVFPRSAATAWDLDFHDAGGTPPCEETVTIGSTCYNKWDVNYALWGLGAKRCKLAFQAAKAEAWIYKIYKAVDNYVSDTYKPGAGGTPDGIWEFSGTMSGWAKYGFDYPSGHYPSAQAFYGACEISDKKGKVTIHEWPW